MSSAAYHKYLKETIIELDRALAHLDFSAQAVADLNAQAIAIELNEEALAQVEAFTSRFARVIDLLSKRVLRALDQYEMQDPGTLLDVANRAEKRGIIPSVDWLRELKDTRNQISHDYAGDRLLEILQYCRQKLPELLTTCTRAKAYIENL
jgi:uncharacterized protein YutE (UPF0331/DUF86 family)